jgi:antagonist of KipI
LRPGLFTTVQDRGRWGFQAQGVPVCGAMDLVSHRLANALVGNDAAAATLEATIIGPEIRLEQDTMMAIGGADLSATVDGTALPPYQARRCAAGSVVRCGERRRGARAYLAFEGGVEVPAVLGSFATHVRSGMGGLGGRAAAAGDRIAIGPPPAREAGRVRDVAAPPVHGGARVRVLPGPQDDLFDAHAFQALQGTRFTIASQSDRMGYRLEGGRIPHADRGEMISDATFAGAIQVPASGEPILLMADRQTTGGYPQIATVITADLPLAAQLAPGDWIEFEVCTRTQALKALGEQEARVRAHG